MPFTVTLDAARHRLVAAFSGTVGDAQLVAARQEAARLNEGPRVRDFLLDFTEVQSLELGLGGIAALRDVDESRVAALAGGRCAIVGRRPIVVEALTLLGAVSVLPLDFRLPRTRADAEAWLDGTLSYDPPRPPRRR